MGLLATFLLGIFIILGALIANFAESRWIEQLSIAIALGTMSLLVLGDLLPEALEFLPGKKIPFIFLFAALGIIILKVLDYFMPEHTHHQEEQHSDGAGMAHIGMVTALAIVVHNLIEGMAIYSMSVQSLRLSLLMVLGVGLHNIPMGMIIFSTIKGERRQTRYAIMTAVTLSTFAGGLMMFSISGLLNDFLQGALIALALGMLIYIIFAELLPYVLRSKQKKLSISGVCLGAAIMLFSSLAG